MRQRFQIGQPATLRFVPPDLETLGAPESASVVVARADGTEIASGAATVDPVSTTITVPADEGDRELEVASAAGIRPGARYLLGESIVEVSGVSGATVLLADPLLEPVEADAEFVGVELSFALTAEQAGTIGLYRAAWTFKIGEDEHHADELFEVRRRILSPVLEQGEVLRKIPADWPLLVKGGGPALRDRMADGWTDLLDDLAERGLVPDRIMDASRLRQAHREKVIANLFESFGPQYVESASAAAARYSSRLEGVVASPDWYDVSDDAVQTKDERSVTFSSVRLTR